MTTSRRNDRKSPSCPRSQERGSGRAATNRAITVTVVAISMAIFAPLDVQAQPPHGARHEDARNAQEGARESADHRQPDRRHQAPTDQTSPCEGAKLEASGTYVDETLQCVAKAEPRSVWASIECLRHTARRLTDNFARQERTGECKTIGEAAAFKAFVDPAIADLAASLGEPGRSRCTKQKLLAAGVDAEDKFRCQARAVSQGAGMGIDTTCWAHAEEELADAFQQAERKGDCAAGTGDAVAIDDKIDVLVTKARSVISPAVSSCTPVEVTTVHGDNFHGSSRLAKIENGTVPCMHVDDGTVATCRFSVSGQASGEWLEGPEGNFAKMGQALSLDGARGGDYVVAARVSDVSCVEPTGMDTAGWVADGIELISDCMLEEAGFAFNTPIVSYAGGFFNFDPKYLINYTTREVCSSNDPAVRPHPDLAEFVRTIVGRDGNTAYCYTGPGAALNDINGVERDAFGYYLHEQRYCHMIVSGGYEAPGAKRPATRSLPAPGSVNTSTPIVWRPVNPNLNIANDLAPDPLPEIFTDRATFISMTHAESASGELPDLGVVAASATVGSVTFAVAPGGNGIAIGAAGTPAAPSWYPDLDGNWIALGYENLQVAVTFPAPVYAMGFDVVEPNATMPPWGGTPVDSTYEVTLFNNATMVGRFTFNAPDDVLAFVGVRNAIPFNRAWIIDVTRDATGHLSPFIDDDEYFGQFYVGRQ